MPRVPLQTIGHCGSEKVPRHGSRASRNRPEHDAVEQIIIRGSQVNAGEITGKLKSAGILTLGGIEHFTLALRLRTRLTHSAKNQTEIDSKADDIRRLSRLVKEGPGLEFST